MPGRRVAQVAPGNLKTLLDELALLDQRSGYLSYREISKELRRKELGPTDRRTRGASYTTVHTLLTRQHAAAPKLNVLLSVVEVLASKARGCDVEETLDRFDGLWRAADDVPYTTEDPLQSLEAQLTADILDRRVATVGKLTRLRENVQSTSPSAAAVSSQPESREMNLQTLAIVASARNPIDELPIGDTGYLNEAFVYAAANPQAVSGQFPLSNIFPFYCEWIALASDLSLAPSMAAFQQLTRNPDITSMALRKADDLDIRALGSSNNIGRLKAALVECNADLRASYEAHYLAFLAAGSTPLPAAARNASLVEGDPAEAEIRPSQLQALAIILHSTDDSYYGAMATALSPNFRRKSKHVDGP